MFFYYLEEINCLFWLSLNLLILMRSSNAENLLSTSSSFDWCAVHFSMSSSTTKCKTFVFFWISPKCCLLVRCLSIFDSFGASQAVHRNLWYKKIPFIEASLFTFGLICHCCPGTTIRLPNITEYLGSR